MLIEIIIDNLYIDREIIEDTKFRRRRLINNIFINRVNEIARDKCVFLEDLKFIIVDENTFLVINKEIRRYRKDRRSRY